ncbi:MAG: bile acid:sodium symporter family protein [Mailhella sp.]|nr:bile acid:sodium symporter family protein [Mailhella sp.]
MNTLARLSAMISGQIGPLILIFSLAAFLMPGAFIWTVSYTAAFLAVIMFGMGLTIRAEDFKAVITSPKPLLFGCAAQFTIMPALAWLLAHVLGLPADIAVGIILVGCCPGGTSSNVITYLAKGDVALSVGMTIVSTLAAPLMTPLLVYWLAGSWVEVSFWAMMLSVVKIVVVPVLGGLVLRRLAERAVDKVAAFCPLVSTAGIVLIVSGIIAANAGKILDCGPAVMMVVVVHSAAGILIGLAASRILGLSPERQTAVSIEVGLQNSGLAVALAAVHFAANPLATLPGAIWSAWQVVMGGFYAGWRRRCSTRD